MAHTMTPMALHIRVSLTQFCAISITTWACRVESCCRVYSTHGRLFPYGTSHLRNQRSWLYSLFSDRGERCQRSVSSKFADKKISYYKLVGDWISAPSRNFVAMATRVGPATFCMVPLIGHPRKPRVRPKHLRSICHTSRLIGDFVQKWGVNFGR